MEKLKFERLPYLPFRLTSPFISRDSPNKRKGLPAGATTYHDGIDCGRDREKYPAPYGNKPAGNVYSVLAGTVVESTYYNGRGHTVLIDHGRIDGHKVLTLYQHLAGSGKPEGTKVAAGEVIGQMGRTGMGADMAIHLHFELRIDGVCVDPLPYIKECQKESSAKLPARLKKMAGKVQKELHFTDGSMEFLCTHTLPEELFRKILAGEELSPQTVEFIKKNKNGKFILSRIEEYKAKLKEQV